MNHRFQLFAILIVVSGFQFTFSQVNQKTDSLLSRAEFLSQGEKAAVYNKAAELAIKDSPDDAAQSQRALP